MSELKLLTNNKEVKNYVAYCLYTREKLKVNKIIIMKDYLDYLVHFYKRNNVYLSMNRAFKHEKKAKKTIYYLTGITEEQYQKLSMMDIIDAEQNGYYIKQMVMEDGYEVEENYLFRYIDNSLAIREQRFKNIGEVRTFIAENSVSKYMIYKHGEIIESFNMQW